MTERDHIAALKDAADPDRVAADLGLRGRGRRFFCPACQPSGGKTPDLSVTDKGFVCFKCGLKGDLLKLVQVAGGTEFPDAVALLEGLTGIKPPVGRRRKGGHPAMDRARPVNSGASCKAGKPITRPEDGSGPDPLVYSAFLDACRPVDGPALAWLKDKVPGMTDALIEGLRLRFCGREYADIMDGLLWRFGESALVKAGLLKRSKAGRLVPSFWHYYASKAGFLVIPYLVAGQPVFLKVRPPVSKEVAERKKLVRFMNTAAAVPVLYNADALTVQPEGNVLICEGESDTWSALAAGRSAVGIPGAKGFKDAWIESFRAFVDADGRSRVILALDVDKAGTDGAGIIAGLFRKAGLPVPLKLGLPPGMDLTEFMKEGMTA